MTERYIRNKYIDQKKREGFEEWHPPVPRSVYIKEKDIFGVFDLILTHKISHDVYWIQLTSAPNMAARRTKIIERFRRDHIFFKNAFVVGYHKGRREFREIEITYQDVYGKTKPKIPPRTVRQGEISQLGQW